MTIGDAILSRDLVAVLEGRIISKRQLLTSEFLSLFLGLCLHLEWLLVDGEAALLNRAEARIILWIDHSLHHGLRV